MKMLPIAIAGLFVSFLFQCSSEAQFQFGRYGGISINIPLGGYGYGGHGHVHDGHGYGGYGYGDYGHVYDDHGYGGYGPHVGIPIYPDPFHGVPAYRAPIYTPHVPSFSLRVDPSVRDAAPRRSYVYPQPYSDRLDESMGGYDPGLGEVYGNYQSAYPNAPNVLETELGTIAVDEELLLQSASLLRQSLSRRSDDADIWLDYLNPDLIIDTVETGGDASALRELLKNYDGLSGNAELSNLWVEPGFRRTHQGLRNYVESPGENSDEIPVISDQTDLAADPPIADPPIADPPIADPQPNAIQNLPSPI